MSQKLSKTQLLAILDKAKQKVKIGFRYVHYKSPDKLYLVKDIAIIEASEEAGVIYEALYPELEGTTWVRPLSDFLKIVEYNGEKLPRFKLLEE